MPGGDPTERRAVRAHAPGAAEMVDASRRKRLALARLGRSTTAHHVVPLRGELRTRPVIRGRVQVRHRLEERARRWARTRRPAGWPSRPRSCAARQALAAAPVEVRRCWSTATGCSGRSTRRRAPRATRPGCWSRRSGAAIAAPTRRPRRRARCRRSGPSAEQRVALGGDGGHGRERRWSDVEPGPLRPTPTARGTEGRRSQASALRRAYTGNVTFWR